MSLRVALDGRPLQSQPLGGVGRYLKGTIPALAEHADVFVLLDGRRPLTVADIGDRAHVVSLSAPPRVPGLAWLELAVAPWLRRFAGVFHGTFNVLPLSFRGRAAVTLHDLAPQLHPEDFHSPTRAAWRLYMRAAAKRAGAVTTVSEFSKAQIVDYFGLDPDRVIVAPDAVDPVFDAGRAEGAAETARAHGIEPPYVVAIGGAPRRALPIALEAWREARRRMQRPLTLAVVGEPDLPAEPGLVALGRVEDETWATLLAGAQALCYPTRYEGFGLPALEALASGTPVVCNPVASLPEVLGDAACWAASPSSESVADVLVRLLSDHAWHARQRAAGLARARAASTWNESASALLAAYRLAAA